MQKRSPSAGKMGRLTLALDVDGVLLDPDRNGEGLWTNQLAVRFGIEHAQKFSDLLGLPL